MKHFAFTASTLAIMATTPAFAQNEVEVLSDWSYDTLYTEGWSVENMFDEAEVVDITGEVIGDIENVIFSNEGEVLGIIAQVGGFWDIGDTHVHVPWDEVTITSGIGQVQVPVTEETVDDYDVFGGYWDEQVITEADTDETQPVEDDLIAGADIFKATDLIGEYAYLSDGARYGYISDIIVGSDMISAIVTDAGAYGRPGYYAYPYNYGVNPMTTQRYDMPYSAEEIDTIENFDYEQLATRLGE
jgi:sporulation protein YlmC with PRC-barrel domain